MGKKIKIKKTAPIADKPPKPSLEIDSQDLKGNSLEVGKKVTVKVTGTVIEESIRDWETPKRKWYRMEVDKVQTIEKE